MLRRSIAILAMLSFVLAACSSASGGGGDTTLDKTMTDTVQAYSEALYHADSDKIPSVVCQQDVSGLQSQLAQNGPLPKSNNTIDLSGITFKVDKRSGDLVRLAIVSGSVKITTESGTVLPDMPVPGSASGIVLKNENGWKVCYGAAGSL